MSENDTFVGSLHKHRTFEECVDLGMIYNSNSGEGKISHLSDERLSEHSTRSAKKDRAFEFPEG